MIGEFSLHRPASVDEACEMLLRGGEDACVYAGGTELLLILKLGLAHYAHLVDIKPLGLDGIARDDATGVLRIGATATHRQVTRSVMVWRHCPVLPEATRQIANVRVRATGTVGGNLCFAEPHSDLASLLILLDAQLQLSGPDTHRTLPASSFFLDEFTTALEPGEILTAIDLPASSFAAAYHKYGMLERPSVSAGCAVSLDAERRTLDGARVVVGCVGPTPVLADEAARILRGAAADPATFSDLAGEAGVAARRACDPVTDLHGSAEYKRHITEVLVRRAIDTALQRATAGADDA